jgi:hypothetical protein
MESNIGTIAITVTSSVEAERLKQNLMNSNHNNSSSSSSNDNNNGDPSSGRGNMPSIRMSHDSTGNHDVESGRLSHHNTSSSAAAAASTTTTTATSSILNTHLSQRERKISQKLNPNLNPDHPNNNINSSSAGDHTSSTIATTTTTVPVVKDRKKVLSTRVINSFEISDDSTAAAVPTDRKSKSKK